jgi:hypothetical protein
LIGNHADLSIFVIYGNSIYRGSESETESNCQIIRFAWIESNWIESESRFF